MELKRWKNLHLLGFWDNLIPVFFVSSWNWGFLVHVPDVNNVKIWKTEDKKQYCTNFQVGPVQVDRKKPETSLREMKKLIFPRVQMRKYSLPN